jgi:hypothetical protein
VGFLFEKLPGRNAGAIKGGSYEKWKKETLLDNH